MRSGLSGCSSLQSQQGGRLLSKSWDNQILLRIFSYLCTASIFFIRVTGLSPAPDSIILMPIEDSELTASGWTNTAFLVAGFLGIPIKDRFLPQVFSSCGNNCCLVKGVIAIDIVVIINYKIT
jgi:hypothetical protein